jgi:flagellum-specific peptidoglycan hydrolase FlgJ
MKPLNNDRLEYINFMEVKDMDVNSFINKVAPGAISTMHTRGILASLSISQAALESGWGSHAPGNNLFGIKANGFKGATQILTTTEIIKGKAVEIKDTFRAYPTWAASIDDHAIFLVTNRRYKNIIGSSDYRIACQSVQSDGYSTSPYYAQVLISIIEKHGLAKYDKAAIVK